MTSQEALKFYDVLALHSPTTLALNGEMIERPWKLRGILTKVVEVS